MSIIHSNYIKNTTIYQNFIGIKWLVDFRKDPIPEKKKLLILVRYNSFLDNCQFF